MRASLLCWPTGLAVMISGAVCLPTAQETALDPSAMVTIRIVNASVTQFVSPNLRVCPKGLSEPPHYFVDPPPVLAPGQETTYTTGQIAGADGDCRLYPATFMIGMCGWQYGTDAGALSPRAVRYGGQIGVQFSTGDTVTLRWTEGADGGSWTSDVEPAPGNSPPSAAFQLIP